MLGASEKRSEILRYPVLVLALALALPQQVLADGRVPLSKDPQLEAGLKIVAEGHIVRKYCDLVSLRFFRAFSLMSSLKSRARDLGYSEAEMKAYFDDKAQKERVEAKAMAKLVAAGASVRKPESFCDVAREKIAADEGFGHYLTIQ